MIRFKEVRGKKQVARTREEPKLATTPKLYQAISRKFGRAGVTTPLESWLQTGAYVSHAVNYVGNLLPVTEVFIAGRLIFVITTASPGRAADMRHYEVQGLTETLSATAG